MNLLPERISISISRLIVINHLIRLGSPKSRRPNVVGRIGWIDNARTAWDHLWIVSTQIVLLPVDTTNININNYHAVING